MLFYRSFGNKDNQPLVFLHGFLGSSKDFLPLIEKLQDEYYCLSLDLPAHGNSPYLPNILVAVQKSIEALVKNPILIGYSLGGRIALHLSQRTNLSPKATFILSAHTGLICPTKQKERFAHDLHWAEKLKTLPPSVFVKSWYEQPIFASLNQKPELLQQLLEKRLFKNPEELSLVLMTMSLAHQPLLDAFAPSTYLLYGEEDTKIKDLYLKLSPAKIEIKNAGHMVHLENPHECLKAIYNNIPR